MYQECTDPYTTDNKIGTLGNLNGINISSIVVIVYGFSSAQTVNNDYLSIKGSTLQQCMNVAW